MLAMRNGPGVFSKRPRCDISIELKTILARDTASRGMDRPLRAGFAATPFGDALIAEAEQGICWLSFVDGQRRSAWRELEAAWQGEKIERDQHSADQVVARLFGGVTGRRPVRAVACGTAFQCEVWRALLDIPAGRVRTYGEIARQIGSPAGSRAVGGAVGRNRLAVLVPCHRVVPAAGGVGGYRWGAARKRAILAWEGVS